MKVHKEITNLWIATVILALMIMLVGCPGSNWQKAATLSDDFAHSIKAAQDIEVTAARQGLVSPVDHQSIELVFAEVAKDGQSLDSAIRRGSSSKTITEAFGAALEATRAALEANQLHIKDPNVKAELEIALTGAKGILDTMEALK